MQLSGILSIPFQHLPYPKQRALTVTVGLVLYRRLVMPKERQWTADLIDSVLRRGRINGDLLWRGRYRETHHSVCFGTGI
jgi:hypothetical protein